MRPFKVITADPPWAPKDTLPGPKRGAAKHYPVMSIAELKLLPVCGWFPPIADDAHLFMWRLASMQEEALELVRAWGFTPKAEVVWVKKTVHDKRWFGMGRQVRMEHEVCLIATRGRPKVRSRSIRSVFEARAGAHSAKPETFYTQIVEKLCYGPRVELFGRRSRRRWTVIGNEVDAPGTALKKAA